VLLQLLAANSDLNVIDTEMRRPLHYAAVCETSDNLKLLLDKGANITDIDMRKVTVLIAAV
jgi:ankyrin repeat protein